jgi:hypothetical protein
MNIYKFHADPESLDHYEERLAKVPKFAFEHALHGLGARPRRFPEGESAIAKSAKYSLMYALMVLFDRFPDGEPAIAKDARRSYEYAHVFDFRFTEGEPAIAESPKLSYDYAKDVVKGRFPAGEEAIAKDGKYAYVYAQYVLRDRFPEGERYVSKWSPRDALSYAVNLVKGPWPEGEPVIATAADTSLIYARTVLGHRFILGEKAIKSGNKFIKSDYETFFNVKL